MSKRRAELIENEQATEFFEKIRIDGDIANENEYLTRTFYGQVNIFLGKNGMAYSRIERIFDLSPEMRKKYMARQFLEDGNKNPNYRAPNLKVVLSFALGLKLKEEEANRLLDSADMAPLKSWRIHRGDDIILNHYDDIIKEIDMKEEQILNGEDVVINEIQTVNDEFVARGLNPLFVNESGGKYE